MGERDIYDVLLQKSADFLPAIPLGYIKHQQVVRSVGKIVQNITIVPVETGKVTVLVSLRKSNTIDPLPHWCAACAEVVYCAIDPRIRLPQRQNKLAPWVALIEIPVDYRPWVVLEGIVLFDNAISQFVNVLRYVGV